MSPSDANVISAGADAALVCSLCDEPGGELVWQDAQLRVILAQERDYPGFCRVIWSAHVAELSDLDAAEQAHLMHIVRVVEQVVRKIMLPDKMNLASLGNQVPHLHWHVIPRFTDDAHFPSSVWAPTRRTVSSSVFTTRQMRATLLPEALRGALG